MSAKRAIVLMTFIGFTSLATGLFLAYLIGTGTHAEPARTLLTVGLVLALVGGTSLLGIYAFPYNDRKGRP